MEAKLIQLFLTQALPLIIDWLKQKGYINAAEALAADGLDNIAEGLANLKIDPTFPGASDPAVKSNINS